MATDAFSAAVEARAKAVAARGSDRVGRDAAPSLSQGKTKCARAAVSSKSRCGADEDRRPGSRDFLRIEAAAGRARGASARGGRRRTGAFEEVAEAVRTPRAAVDAWDRLDGQARSPELHSRRGEGSFAFKNAYERSSPL